MKNQDKKNRYTQDFGAGLGHLVQVMPLGGKVLKAAVRLYGTLHVAAGGGADGTVRFADILAGALFTRIRVRVTKADGSRYPDGVIVDVDPRSLLRRAMFSRKAFYADQNATAFAGGVADYVIDYRFPIYFAQTDLKRGIETALNVDVDAYKNYQIEVDTGNRDSVMAGSTRAFSFVDLKVDFMDEREAIAGDTYVLVQDDHEYLIPGAGTRRTDPNFPVDGKLLDILLMTQTGTGAGSPVLANTLLNRVIIEGENIGYDQYAPDITEDMRDRKEVDLAQSLTGVFHVNFVASGMLTKAVPAPGLDLKLDVLNPSGANADSILVNTRRIFAPSGYTPIQFGQRGANNAKSAR
jgi:hypothetical protein